MLPEARATYRLQLSPRFGFDQLTEIISYLADLGISHIYTSPYLQAVPDSKSGYDIVDHSQINNQLGDAESHARLCATLQANGLGLILDIVPNHMAITQKENKWWWDVLKMGKSSPYAKYFDIHWEPSNKILIPILDDSLDAVIKRGEFYLKYDGEWILHYRNHSFPLSDYTEGESIETLIEKQNYRFASWRSSNQELNYRRFFDIRELAGLRMEEEKLFNHTHALPLQWYLKGWIQGLRVDHPDGLSNPTAYFMRLKKTFPNTWIIAEKILESGEKIPSQWHVDGTTGYDFLNLLTELFINSDGDEALTKLYQDTTGVTENFQRLVYQSKLQVLQELFNSEVKWLTDIVTKISAYMPSDLINAITQVIAFFPVYRTYITPDGITPTDQRYIDQAIELALQEKTVRAEIYHFLKDLLLLRFAGTLEAEFVTRFQQLTGPVMAKGFEDTALYRFHRCVALNEVGGNPSQFGMTLQYFHEKCLENQTKYPLSLLASSTHDTKRSEDVRARLVLLSEIPADFGKAMQRWMSRHKTYLLDDNTEYLFYQTLIGAWPIEKERLIQYMQKAVREAKQHTSWLNPNLEYEDRLNQFIESVLHDKTFMEDFEQFVTPLIYAGRINSLAQTLIKLTAPGIPDIYQGCELWDLSLVDPDNRRPVDFELRRTLLHQIQSLSPKQILERIDEGLPKLWIIYQTLQLRKKQPQLFNSSYSPLYAQGKKAHHLVAYQRGDTFISATSRLNLILKNDWLDTFLKLPEGLWHNIFTGEKFSNVVPIDKLFKQFPVALLVKLI